jgi:hypothetical protein
VDAFSIFVAASPDSDIPCRDPGVASFDAVAVFCRSGFASGRIGIDFAECDGGITKGCPEIGQCGARRTKVRVRNVKVGARIAKVSAVRTKVFRETAKIARRITKVALAITTGGLGRTQVDVVRTRVCLVLSTFWTKGVNCGG